MRSRHLLHEDDFEPMEDSEFATSADAEPVILEFCVDEGMFWDEIDWLWDCAEWSGELGEDRPRTRRLH